MNEYDHYREQAVEISKNEKMKAEKYQEYFRANVDFSGSHITVKINEDRPMIVYNEDTDVYYHMVNKQIMSVDDIPAIISRNSVSWGESTGIDFKRFRRSGPAFISMYDCKMIYYENNNYRFNAVTLINSEGDFNVLSMSGGNVTKEYVKWAYEMELDIFNPSVEDKVMMDLKWT